MPPAKTKKKRTRAPGAGRPPRAGTAANQSVRVSLTDAELAELDERRGEHSRAEYIRRQVFRHEPPCAPGMNGGRE